MDRRGDAKSREMMLDELLGYDHVTIQCHDNPDADAIASGYGLYCFSGTRERIPGCCIPDGIKSERPT